MKKLLLLSSAVFTLTFGTIAQTTKPGVTRTKDLVQLPQGSFKTATSSNTVLVKDTLHYYLNKFYFETAINEYSAYPIYVSAVATSTSVTHIGSRFDVPAGDSVVVTGLETFARRVQPAVNLTIPIHIILCNLDANGMPDVVHPIDSVTTGVSGNLINLVGGNLIHGPKTMTTSFAVLARNTSTAAGDNAALLRNAATTATNTTFAANTKYADRENNNDYGFVRFHGNFYSTRDFTLAPGFGAGTAYEFVVAPRVEYIAQASQVIPSFAALPNDTTGHVADTICTRMDMVFTNTSSGFFTHRQYNLDQFYRKWNPVSPFPTGAFPGVFSSDAPITWYFEFYDHDNPPRDSRIFLPVNSESISVTTDLAWYPHCFTANQFRARLKPMGAKGTVPSIQLTEDFIVCTMYCNGDTLGIASLKGYDNLKVYPNPAVSGKTQISGLVGKNKIVVYNMLGEIVLSETTENSTMEIDLTKQPKGTYILRIGNSNNQGKAIKLLNSN